MRYLFDEYKRSLKLIELEEFFDVVLYRPLAFLFVKSIYKTSISPNHITFMAVILGVIGGSLLSLASYKTNIIAGIFLLLYDVFDCSDGMLARLKKNGTPFGRALDGLSDYIVGSVVYLGIAIGFAGQEHSIGLWILTLLAATSNAIHAVLVDYYRLRFINYSHSPEDISKSDTEIVQDKTENLTVIHNSIFEKFLTILDSTYLKVQDSIIRRRSEDTMIKGDVYYRQNKSILHFWTFLGTTTQLTFLIVCAFFNRIDIYLWGIVIVGNVYAFTLSIIQVRIDTLLHIDSKYEVAL